MAWLRLEDTFHDHPKFRRLAIHLGCTRVEAKGYVASLWSWVVRHSPDGDLTSLDPIDLAFGADYEKDPDQFLQALIKAQLIDKSQDGLRVHGWIKRAESFKAAKKKREQRAEAKQESRDSPETEIKVSRDSPGTGSKAVPEDPPDRPTRPTHLSVGPPAPTAGEPLKLFVKGYRDGCAEHMKKPIAPGGSTKARDAKLEKMLKRYPMQEPETAGYWLARSLAKSEHHRTWQNWDLGWVAEKADRFEKWLNEGREMLQRSKNAKKNGTPPVAPLPPQELTDEQITKNKAHAEKVRKELTEQLGWSP